MLALIDKVNKQDRDLKNENEFKYSGWNEFTDDITSFHLGTRAVATVVYALFTVEASMGEGTCSTGIGCIVGGIAITHGLDSANAAGQTMRTGKPHSSYGAQAISSLTGMSEQNAELSYDLVSVGANLKLMANAAEKYLPSYQVFESEDEALQAYPHLSVEQEHIPSGVVNGSDVSAQEIGMTWGGGIQKQGMPFEDYVGTILPEDSRLPANFKTFDYYVEETGGAVSVKTLNTQTAAKINNPS